MGAASDLFHELTAHGLIIALEGDNLMVSPRERLTDPLRARIREAKPDLLRLLAGDITMDPDPEPAPVATFRAWLIRHPDGQLFSHTFTPPATLPEVRAWYPGALGIEPQEDDTPEGEEPAPEPPQPGPPDDRITCRQCGHLTGARCQAA